MTKISSSLFGSLPTGEEVSLFTLINSSGMTVKISNLGGIITSISVPDRFGRLGDVVLGFDELEPYLQNYPYFGAVVGRFGNRIAEGKFTLEGKVYQLEINNPPNHLHGGFSGFDKVLWSAEISESATAGACLVLSHISPDGDQGYPGNLNVKVSYSLTDDNELRVHYYATTDQPTPVNLTQHSYFNLAGTGDILRQQVMINADQFTPISATLIPTGEFRSVTGTPFDFRQVKTIGIHLDDNDEQLKFASGYDHNFVLKKDKSDTISLAARAEDPDSGRILEVYTDEPGVQFYSANFLDGSLRSKGKSYQRRAGFCFETQHFPDSPNQSDFPSSILYPDQEYSSNTFFKFFCE